MSPFLGRDFLSNVFTSQPMFGGLNVVLPEFASTLMPGNVDNGAHRFEKGLSVLQAGLAEPTDPGELCR